MVVLLSLGVAAVAVSAPEKGAEYVVQSGDNLWNLAGTRLDDPQLWKELVESNPFLNEPGRVFKRNGKTIVILRPGEKLVGLEKFGVKPMLPEPLLVPLELKNTTEITSSVWTEWPFLLLAIASVMGLLYWLHILHFVPDETVRPAAPAVAAGSAVAAVPVASVATVNASVERKDELISFEFTRGDAKNPNSMVRVKNGSPAFFSFAPDADGTTTFRFRQ